MIGEIYKNTPVSIYSPSNEIAEFTKNVKHDYAQGEEILNKSWTELNDRSVIEDQNRGQIMFNAFVDTSVEDPNESWKWRGTRSMARNKGIAMHANLTAGYLLATFTAQNEDDEVDIGFSELMTDLVEWMAQPINSNYQSSFLQIVFGMLTNPVTFLGAEYCEVFQKIKERKENGEMETKEILDEILSGFQAPIWSASQVLITNAYERNIQKQRRIIKRRYVEKGELEAKYEEHPYWEYVQAGIKSVYNEENGLFYDIKDDEHPNLVAEEIVMGRREDLEVPFVNGIYLGEDFENIDNNPIKHRDNRNAPKYNVTPFGYMRIGEHFFYYKSQMNAVGWDNLLYDAMSEILMNKALLEVEAPIAISGVEKVDSEILFPNAVVAFENPDARVTRLLPESNMNAGFAALRETEKSIDEGSINPVGAGQLPDKDQKVYNVARAEANAKKIIGSVAKSLAESVVNYGDLMKDIAINNITAPEVTEISSEHETLKYKTFSLEGKESAGRRVSKTIKFDPELIGMEMSDNEVNDEEMKMLEEVGYPHNKETLILANPELMAKYKYLSKVDVEEMLAKNSEYWQPILLSLKNQLAKDPYTDQEALTREIMRAFFRSRGDKMVKKAETLQLGAGGGEGSDLAKTIQRKQLSTAASSMAGV